MTGAFDPTPPRMASSDYLEFCEFLWKSWLNGTLRLPDALALHFDLKAAPEPYLRFDRGSRPLIVLTTNPGGTMEHQLRTTILGHSGPVRSSMTYRQAADAFSSHYATYLRGAARHRISAMLELAELVGADGVVQVEACPFHSPCLPAPVKSLLVREYSRPGLVGEYGRHLREFLSAEPVIAVSAVATQRSLTTEFPDSEWVLGIARLVGLDPAHAEFVSLTKRGAKSTCGAYLSGMGRVTRAICLRMGANGLPGAEGRRTLAEAWEQRVG